MASWTGVIARISLCHKPFLLQTLETTQTFSSPAGVRLSVSSSLSCAFRNIHSLPKVTSCGRLYSTTSATWRPLSVRGQSNPHFTQGFGDHNGLVGALDDDGQVYLIASDTTELVLSSKLHSPKVMHIAVTGNGRLAAAVCQAAQASTPYSNHVAEFASIRHFKQWLTFEPAHNHDEKHHIVPGRVVQLVANATTFAYLNDNGEVYTWGDARHRSLGRTLMGQEAAGADEPGLVEALGGIRIARISAGGWITTALSDDGVAYAWGMSTPGKQERLPCLRDIDTAEVALLEILSSDGQSSEPEDVQDIAVGDGHIVLLTSKGEIFTTGDNTNGQLGIGQDSEFREGWEVVRITPQLGITAVRAGPRCTFIMGRHGSRVRQPASPTVSKVNPS